MQSFRDPYSCTMISNSENTIAQTKCGTCVNSAPISAELLSHHQFQSCRLHLCLQLWGTLSSHRPWDLFPPWKSPWERTCRPHNQIRVSRGEFVRSGAGLFVCGSHLSSSSSIKPLPSTSRTLKTSLTLSGDMALRPTNSKNFFGSKVSSKLKKHRKQVQSQLSSSCYLQAVYELVWNVSGVQVTE